MKQFDIEKAKQGHPICTRDGHKARIICFDARGAYPVVVLVDFGDDGEGPVSYMTNGQVRLGLETEFDLFMAHVKHDGLVNIYKTEDGVITSGRTFDNEEKARAYDMALEAMSDIIPDENGLVHIRPSDIFPELAESEDERTRKMLIEFLVENRIICNDLGGINIDKTIAWLKKQDKKKPKWTNEDSSMQLTLMRDIEQISFISQEGKDDRIGWLNTLDERFANQDIDGEQKPKKVSIWKHWKDGIAGCAEGEQIFLIKIGRVYSISSCLGCECDYIKLSELEELNNRFIIGANTGDTNGDKGIIT